MHHLTNVGPDAEWKIEKARDKFPSLPLVYRNYPMSADEFDHPGYDEGVAILNNLTSVGFSRELTDQEMFEFWSHWHNLKR